MFQMFVWDEHVCKNYVPEIISQKLILWTSILPLLEFGEPFRQTNIFYGTPGHCKYA